MKQILLSAALLLSVGLQAQVGVNTEDPKATLEVKAKEKTGTANEGIIAPMLSKARVANIKNPVEGTLIYVIDDADKGGTISSYTGNNDKVANITEKGYYYYDGSAWVKTSGTASFTATNGLTKSGNEVTLGGNLESATTINTNGNNLFFTGNGNIGIGANSAAEKLEVAGKTVISDNAQVLTLKGRNHAYIGFYAKGDNNRSGYIGYDKSAKNTFTIENQIDDAIHIKNNVGIGTDAPTQKLDVVGKARVRTIDECETCKQILITGENGVIQRISLEKLAEKISVAGGGSSTMPKYTNSQRNGLTNVEEGTMIYNTDSHKVEVYNGRGWTTVSTEAVTYTSTKTGSASRAFTRNNCKSGQTGTTVTVTKTATETKTSTKSQAEADRLAQEAADAAAERALNENGQTEANNLGNCTGTPTPEYSDLDVCDLYGHKVGTLYDDRVWMLNATQAVTSHGALNCMDFGRPPIGETVRPGTYLIGRFYNELQGPIAIFKCVPFPSIKISGARWEIVSGLRKCK